MTSMKLGRYEVLGELGKGAMGIVYLARDPIIERRVALKTFRLGYSAGDQELEQFRTRFLREAQSAGILNHPNIVTIHDVVEDTDAGVIFIAMEYVQGTDLKQLMQRRDRLPLRFVLEAVAQIADGLHYAHGKGVVHRDVKPANIIITAEKQVKITDFGIARLNQSNLTVEGQMLGTPNYMAPEQVLARDVDHRADLFSLGVMLYELVTGAKPFQGDNLTVVTHRIVHEPFQPATERVNGLPGPLAAVLDRAMRKNPAERYEDGAEMARDVRAILAPAPSVAAPRATSFLEQGPAAGPGPTSPHAAPTPDPTSSSPVPSSQEPSSDGSESWSSAGDGTLAPTVITQRPGSPRADGSTAPAAEHPRATAPLAPAATTGTGPSTGGAKAKPSLGRLGMVTALSLTLALLLAAGTWLAVTGGRDEAPERTTPEAELQRRWLPLYTEGLALLESGEPAAAIERLDRALAIAPANRKLRQAREQADRVLALLAEGERPEEAALRRVERGQRALDRRRYQEAFDLAEEALELDPRNRDAATIRQQAQEGLARKAQARDRFRTPIARGDAGSTAGSSSGSSSAAPTPSATGTLNIDFRSVVSSGMLTIYIGQESIFRETFDFGEKRGLIRRERNGGSLSATRTVEAGDLKLKLYLWRQGSATEVAELDGTLLAGGARTLMVRANADGNLDVSLE